MVKVTSPVSFSDLAGLSLSSDDDSLEFNGVFLSDILCCQLKTQDVLEMGLWNLGFSFGGV